MAASIAAIAAVWNVSEVNKQRETTFRPELVFSRLDFSGKPITKDNPVPLSWQPIAEKVSSAENSDFSSCLRITNVGLGAAKNVKIEWSFEFDRMAAYIDVLSQMSNYDLRIIKNGNFHALEIRKDIKLGFNKNGEFTQNVGYILNGTQSPSVCGAIIPTSYKVIVSSIFLLSAKTGNFSDFDNIPDLKAKLSYEDIGGSSFSTFHIFGIKVNGVGESFAIGSVVEKPL
ncbi:hypothetical protein [Methylobacterium gnaphalii]|uniref:hypothetical protein n=1 Tax=Methylobacterium gnaphalii TaxID=1010610 RepID=UPI0011BDF6D4|nr:hypothetical protein [Methylobacterium gnaphalii]